MLAIPCAGCVCAPSTCGQFRLLRGNLITAFAGGFTLTLLACESCAKSCCGHIKYPAISAGNHGRWHHVGFEPRMMHIFPANFLLPVGHVLRSVHDVIPKKLVWPDRSMSLCLVPQTLGCQRCMPPGSSFQIKNFND